MAVNESPLLPPPFSLSFVRFPPPLIIPSRRGGEREGSDSIRPPPPLLRKRGRVAENRAVRSLPKKEGVEEKRWFSHGSFVVVVLCPRRRRRRRKERMASGRLEGQEEEEEEEKGRRISRLGEDCGKERKGESFSLASSSSSFLPKPISFPFSGLYAKGLSRFCCCFCRLLSDSLPHGVRRRLPFSADGRDWEWKKVLSTATTHSYNPPFLPAQSLETPILPPSPYVPPPLPTSGPLLAPFSCPKLTFCLPRYLDSSGERKRRRRQRRRRATAFSPLFIPPHNISICNTNDIGGRRGEGGGKPERSHNWAAEINHKSELLTSCFRPIS